MTPYEDTLKKIGFESVSPSRSEQWEWEALNFYADWNETCTDEEYERVYPPQGVAEFTSIRKMTDAEAARYEES
jgi:hypothetical protein